MAAAQVPASQGVRVWSESVNPDRRAHILELKEAIVGETIILRSLTHLYGIARSPMPKYHGCRIVAHHMKPNRPIARF